MSWGAEAVEQGAKTHEHIRVRRLTPSALLGNVLLLPRAARARARLGRKPEREIAAQIAVDPIFIKAAVKIINLISEIDTHRRELKLPRRASALGLIHTSGLAVFPSL